MALDESTFHVVADGMLERLQGAIEDALGDRLVSALKAKTGVTVELD